jgi:redox-sensitive bicupin YhaK (pirin superfamily)
VIEGNGSRVRVALGVHRIGDDIKIADDKVGLLDVFICAGKAYVHEIARDRKTWIYVVSGHLEAIIGNEHCVIQSGQLTYVSAGPAITLGTTSDVATHCVLISPKPWPNQ